MKLIGNYSLSMLLVSILLGTGNCEEQGVVSGVEGVAAETLAPLPETLNVNAKLDSQVASGNRIEGVVNVNKLASNDAANGRRGMMNPGLNKNFFLNPKFLYGRVTPYGYDRNPYDEKPSYDRNPYDEKPKYDNNPYDEKPKYDRNPYDEKSNYDDDKDDEDEKTNYDKPRHYDYDDDKDDGKDDNNCYLRNGVFMKPKCPDTRRRCNRGNLGAFCYPNKYGKNDCPPCWVYNRDTCNWDCYDYQPNSKYDGEKCIFDWIDIWNPPKYCSAKYDD